ncbi:MAG: 5'-nucleotidase [Acidimicrobiales bacterium]|jgi:5'-nucleotidase
MRILVTNDDGIESTGLHVLAQRLTHVGDVVVLAPSGEYSGAGAAVGHLSAGIADLYQVERSEMPDVHSTYHLDAPPALASLLACQGLLGPAPDLVVSGINPGWNVGHAVHFSGTIGACITANMFSIPCIAVSQHTAGDAQQWPTAAQAAVDQIERVMASGELLNVNVPNVAMDEVVGVTDTTLSRRIPYGLHSPQLHHVADGRSRVTFERFGPYESPPGCDTDAVLAGCISVTALHSTRAVIG